MTEIKTENYIIASMQDVSPQPCPCGTTRRAFVDEDNDVATFHLLQVDNDAQTHYHKTLTEGDDAATEAKGGPDEAPPESPGIPEEPIPDEPVLKERHLTIQENQKGVSFHALLGPYLRGAGQITVTDPYIRLFYQTRNFMELLETIVNLKSPDEEVAVHLVTMEDEFRGEQQKAYFEEIQKSSGAVGIHFTWEFDGTGTIHARHIVTDHGWKILLDRGLDIFQHYEMNAAFSFSNRLQQCRRCKAFEVTFIPMASS